MKVYLLAAMVLFCVPVCLAEDAALKVTDLKLFPDTPKGHFAKPLDGYEFPASQQRQLAIVYFAKSAAGQKVVARIVGERTTMGADKEVITFQPVGIDPEGRLPIELKFPKSVPPGLYRIDLIQNDKVVGSAGYIVRAAEAKKTPVSAEKIDIRRLKGDGTLESVAVPKAADRHLYFVAETKGARTAGAHVVWSYVAVDTTAGKNQVLPSLDQKDWPLDDTTLAFDMELPRDWPLGKYHVSLKVDDEMVKEIDFEIKE